MDYKKIRAVAEEAARLKRENPSWNYTKCAEKARREHENARGIQGKQQA